ncbi:MAG: DUF1648 domain-containing protein [Candidatus Nanopelagicales bacterium]
MSTAASPTAPADQAVRRFKLVAIYLPLALTALFAAVQLWAIPELPDPVAVHWGVNGHPNGFGSAWTSFWLTIACCLLMTGLFGLSVLPALRRGDRGPMLRFLGSMSLGMTVFLGGVVTWTLLRQRGLADAAAGPSITLPMVGSLALGLLAGLVAWWLQPHQEAARAFEARPVALSFAPTERVAWMGSATAGRGLFLLVGGGFLVLAGSAGLAWLLADQGVALIVTATTLLVAVAAMVTLHFHVRIDGAGLAIRAPLGWPRWLVPIGEITDVAVIDVNPLADFGGWGVRMRPGATGIILRSGKALQVTRSSGRKLVVTVADPMTAAAVLAGLRQQIRSEGAGQGG